MAEPDTLRPRQMRALAELLVQPNLIAAAAAAGVAPRTLYRWLDEPAFAEAYRRARRETVQHAIVTLQRNAGEATATLIAIAQNPNERVGARVAAAKAILELAIRGIELEDILARLEALEARINGGDGGIIDVSPR